jgi:hypothetical protein
MTAKIRQVAFIDVWDEVLLGWYFSRGTAGFERSTFGAVLDRQHSQVIGSRPCSRCEGAGVLNEPWVRTVDIHGEPLKEPERLESGQECPNCGGTGSKPRRIRARKHSRHGYYRCHACRGTGREFVEVEGSDRKVPGKEPCGACYGRGYTLRNAVFQTAQEYRSPIAISASEMARYGMAGRYVGLVRAKSPISAVALELYYGDIGAKWARTVHGRAFSLYLLTPAGRKLLRSADARNDAGDRTPIERLGVLASQNRLEENGPNAALFLQAGVAAMAIQQQMATVWNQVKRRSGTRDETTQQTD